MLELINGKVVLDPDLFTIPQFREIWNRDESEDKRQAFAYISFIFNFNNPKSPYFNHVETERQKIIIEKFFPEELQSVELYNDKAFIQASEIYRGGLKLSPMRAVLEVCKEALYEISNTLKSAATDATTKLNSMGKLTKAFEEYKRAEKLINEDEINSNVKGSRIIRRRER